MFLIECAKGRFVNAEKIQLLIVDYGIVKFYIDEAIHESVDAEYAESFLNNLQVINNNVANVQSRFLNLKKEA